MAINEESSHQRTLLNWVKLNLKRHPELYLFHSIPNGAHVTPWHRARLVSEGLKRGMPDLHLPVPRGVYHSLYLELKTESGSLGRHQKEIIERLSSYGNLCCVSRGIQQSIDIIEKYLTQHP